jgi:hypothetical protein
VKTSTSVFWGVVAAFLSMLVNNSGCWAFFHFFCSYFYVLYWIIFYSYRFVNVL